MPKYHSKSAIFINIAPKFLIYPLCRFHRFPVTDAAPNVEKLLGIPKFTSGTGFEIISTALFHAQ